MKILLVNILAAILVVLAAILTCSALFHFLIYSVSAKPILLEAGGFHLASLLIGGLLLCLSIRKLNR